jgi:hypothetical protein
LAKKKSSIDESAINEAQQLWDKLCQNFKMPKASPRLTELIKKSNKDIYFDKSVKRLITLKTDNELAFAEQILAHDILVLCFVLNSEKELKTDTPEKYWTKLLDKIANTSKLPHIYDSGTVLQTITDNPTEVADLVKENMGAFKNKKVSSSTLDFGKLWRFGEENQYLLTINNEHEEQANSFLGFSFAYIITLISKIQNHYKLAVKLYEEMAKKENIINEFRNKLDKTMENSEPAILEARRNELRNISNETTNDLTYLSDCGVNIQNNIINLEGVLKDLKFAEMEDEGIFSKNLELFEEHVQNINSWVKVCEGTLSRINKSISDIREILKEQIDKLEEIKPGPGRKPQIDKKEIANAEEIETLELESRRILDWGNFYVINDVEFDKSLDIFEQFLKLKNPGLCISRTHPKKLKKEHDLENATIYWLSTTSCNYCLSPALEKIEHVITEYLKNNVKSIFLFDGLEHLAINNEFIKVIKLIDFIKEQISLYNSILILPFSYSAFSGKEISLIMKNMQDITDVDVMVV